MGRQSRPIPGSIRAADARNCTAQPCGFSSTEAEKPREYSDPEHIVAHVAIAETRLSRSIS
jgi:hypothetical protein